MEVRPHNWRELEWEKATLSTKIKWKFKGWARRCLGAERYNRFSWMVNRYFNCLYRIMLWTRCLLYMKIGLKDYHRFVWCEIWTHYESIIHPPGMSSSRNLFWPFHSSRGNCLRLRHETRKHKFALMWLTILHTVGLTNLSETEVQEAYRS